MWVNFNYFAVIGLEDHGYSELAASLRDTTISCVQKYYEQLGKIFEFYDSSDEGVQMH